MQFHLNGFKPGDPEIADASEPAALRTEAVPETVDVLIVGCGPAGLTLAAQLAVFPDIRTCIVEQTAGPLQLGRADGVACRSMEMTNGSAHIKPSLSQAPQKADFSLGGQTCIPNSIIVLPCLEPSRTSPIGPASARP